MRAREIIQMIEAQGIRLEVRDDRLRYYPASSLTTKMRAALVKYKAEILVELAQRPQAVTDILGAYSAPISLVVSTDDRRELLDCHDSANEHQHKRIERKLPSEEMEILIPESLPIDVVERCFNGYCEGLLEFKQGRAYCSRCGVYQRIIE